MKVSDLKSDHNPTDCPHKRVHVRRLENDEDLEVVDDDEDEIDEDGNENVARLQHESNSPLFQTLNTSEQGQFPAENTNKCDSYDQSFHVNLLTSENVSFIADKIVRRLQSSSAKSPSLLV